MYLNINIEGGEQYKSNAQKARFLTERWAHENIFCPGCGGKIGRYNNNTPVADFYCLVCLEDFELKSTAGNIGKTIPDGAYGTMIDRLSSKTNPNLIILQYHSDNWSVKNLTAMPKYYFIPDLIQKRTPLASTAKRADWIGCNILIGNIPTAGTIKIVFNEQVESTESVLSAWKKTSFLKEINNDSAKGWLLQTMQCIDHIGKKKFELNDIYKFEDSLKTIYPNNIHIKEKLRQKLQLLRDKGYLKFVGKGVYELQ